jgi:hypothetical protein
MTTVVIIWLIIFGISALVFFGVAIIITFFGFSDLKDLLSKSDKKTDSKFN